MKDFEDTRRHPDAPSKFPEERHWRQMDRTRESSQPTTTTRPASVDQQPPEDDVLVQTSRNNVALQCASGTG
ncbi:hypothetical protein Trydic_g9643 [Trypoxylus dichotomus]